MMVDVVRLHAEGKADAAEDLFDAWLPLVRHEVQPGLGLSEPHRGQRGHCVQQRDPFVGEPAHQLRGIFQYCAVGNGQRGSGSEGNENLAQHHIERQPGDMGHTVAGHNGEGLALPRKEMGQTTVRAEHALGAAGGAGSEEEIGRIVEAWRFDVRVHQRMGERQIGLQHGVLARGQSRPGATQDHTGAGLLQRTEAPRQRLARIERQRNAARQNNPQQAGDEFTATMAIDGHHVTRPAARAPQLSGNRSRRPCELRVGPVAPGLAQGDRPRGDPGLQQKTLGDGRWGGTRLLADGDRFQSHRCRVLGRVRYQTLGPDHRLRSPMGNVNAR